MRPCLFCPKVVVAYSQHLRVTHHVRNAKERVILCKWQSGRVNIRQQACPVAECTTHARNLQRHIMESHTELTVAQRRRVLDEVKRRLTIERLTALRATVPLIPLVTDWDLKEAARQEDELFKETSSSTPSHTPYRLDRKSSGAARDVQQPSPTERQIKEEQELWTTEGEDSSQILLLCHTPTVENSGDLLPIKTTDQIKAEFDGALESANGSPSPSVACPDGSTAQSLEEQRVGLLPELKPSKSNGTKTEKMNIM